MLTERELATNLLCDAEKHLCVTRGINTELNIAELDVIENAADRKALKIISIALCVVNGADPLWIQFLRE